MSIDVESAESFLKRFKRSRRDPNPSHVPIVENGSQRKLSQGSPQQKDQNPLPPVAHLGPEGFLEPDGFRRSAGFRLFFFIADGGACKGNDAFVYLNPDLFYPYDLF